MLKPTYDIVISGMGPSGMITAILAAKLGKNVLGVSDRDTQYKRGQKVTIIPPFIDFLNNEFKQIDLDRLDLNDQLFMKKFHAEINIAYSIDIKDIEKFLLIALSTNYQDQVDVVYESEITQINPENAEISIKNKSGVELTTARVIIGADGAHHHAADVINESLPYPQQIKYHPIDQDLYPHHVFARLKIKRSDRAILPAPKRSIVSALKNVEDINYLCNILFDQKSYEKSIQTEIKFNFYGEIPEAFASNIDSRQQAATYVKETAIDMLRKTGLIDDLALEEIEIEFHLNSKRKGVGKDKHNFSIFKRNGNKADRAFVEIEQLTLILIGDALRTPNYQLGHGVNDAFVQAELIANIPSKDEIELKKALLDYQNTVNEMSKTISTFSRIVQKDKQYAIEKLQDIESKSTRVIDWISKAYEDKNMELINSAMISYPYQILYFAIPLRDKDLIVKTLQLHPHIDCNYEFNFTPSTLLGEVVAHHSEDNNLLEIAEILLDHGASPVAGQASESTITALESACAKCQLDLLKVFLNNPSLELINFIEANHDRLMIAAWDYSLDLGLEVEELLAQTIKDGVKIPPLDSTLGNEDLVEGPKDTPLFKKD